MPDVEISIGLRRKTSLDLSTLQGFLRSKVFFNFGFDEILAVVRFLVIRWMGHDA